MAAKFRHGKEQEEEEDMDVFKSPFARSLKLTGQVFTSSGRIGVNYYVLDGMEWLNPEDSRLKDYIRRSLNVIGDCKREEHYGPEHEEDAEDNVVQDNKQARVHGGLTILDTDVDFGFDDSD